MLGHLFNFTKKSNFIGRFNTIFDDLVVAYLFGPPCRPTGQYVVSLRQYKQRHRHYFVISTHYHVRPMIGPPFESTIGTAWYGPATAIE